MKLFTNITPITSENLTKEAKLSCPEITINRTTDIEINKSIKRTPLFWHEQHLYYKIDPTELPELDLFEGKTYFVCITYEKVQGDDGNYNEHSCYTGGYLVIETKNKKTNLKWHEDDRSSWTMKNGRVTYNSEELPFNHTSQILQPFAEELNIPYETEEGIYDNFLNTKVLNRELSYLFFIINDIEYKPYKTGKEWSYSSSNQYYYDSKEYEYWDLENLSHKFIIDNFSDHCIFNNPEDAHSVYSTFMDFLEELGEIEEETFPFIPRLNTIKWLGVTPDNQNPDINFDLSKLKTIKQIEFKEEETVQVKIDSIGKNAVKGYKLAIKYGNDCQNLDVNDLIDNDLIGEIIEFDKDVAFVEFKTGERFRFNVEDLLPESKFVDITEDISKQILIDAEQAIKNFKKKDKIKDEKNARDCFKTYQESMEKHLVLPLIVKLAKLEIKSSISKLSDFAEKQEKKEMKKKYKKIWVKTFKDVEGFEELIS